MLMKLFLMLLDRLFETFAVDSDVTGIGSPCIRVNNVPS